MPDHSRHDNQKQPLGAYKGQKRSAVPKIDGIWLDYAESPVDVLVSTVTLFTGMPRADSDLSLLSGRLRYARRRAQMTQAAAAKRCGVTRQSVGKHERGAAYPTEGALGTYAEVYGIDVEWLRNGSEADRPMGASVEATKRRPSRSGENPFGEGAPTADWVGSRPAAPKRFVCPRCSTGGFRYAELVEHLEDGVCGEPLSGDAAERLARAGDADDVTYFDAIEKLQRWIDDCEALYASTPITDEEQRDIYLKATFAIRRQLQKVLAVGVDGYSPPPGSVLKRPI